MSRNNLKYMLLATGIDRLVKRIYTGRGLILCFHQVYPEADGLPVRRVIDGHLTPDELDTVLSYFADHGYQFVPLDRIPALLASGDTQQPFAAITFDDGFIDTLTYALPVMERHDAPFTVYVSPGKPEKHIGLRLFAADNMIATRDHIVLPGPDGDETVFCRSTDEKIETYNRVLRHVLFHPRGNHAAGQLDAVMALLDGEFGKSDPYRLLLMDDEQLRTLDHHPLATVGAHTMTHPNLARLDSNEAKREIAESKRLLEQLLDHTVAHFAYPYGGAEFATKREFAIARETGFATAVTCRHAFLFPGHAGHPTALPRLIIGAAAYRDTRLLRLYESGVVAMKVNHGRRFVTD